MDFVDELLLGQRYHWDYSSLGDLRSDGGQVVQGLTMYYPSLFIDIKAGLDLSYAILVWERAHDDRISKEVALFVLPLMPPAWVLVPQRPHDWRTVAVLNIRR